MGEPLFTINRSEVRKYFQAICHLAHVERPETEEEIRRLVHELSTKLVGEHEYEQWC